MKGLLAKLFAGKTLSRAEAEAAMNRVLDGEASPEQLGAFLGALQARQETIDEMVGFVSALRRRSIKLPISGEGLLDTCGTGGDGSGTYNISTAAAFILAGGGVPIAKHGNRSSSSRSGSADALEALGIGIENKPDHAARLIQEQRLGFLFAPFFHPDLAKVGPVRRALGVRTVFNLIGPLANPALVSHQVMGVYSRDLLENVAAVLRELGTHEAMIVASEDGLDEFSLSAVTHGVRLKDGKLARFEARASDFGLAAQPDLDGVRGGSPAENAAIIEAVLRGQETGPKRDIAVMNAGAGFVVAGRAKDFREGARLAERAIDDGRAAAVLEALRRDSQKAAP